MSTPAQTRQPPLHRRATPLPTSLHPASAVLCISASILIAAPPAQCLAALRDTRRWHEWNSFCPKVEVVQPTGSTRDSVGSRSGSGSGSGSKGEEGVLRNGSGITMHVRMNAAAPGSLTETKLVVTECYRDDGGGFGGRGGGTDGSQPQPLHVTWCTAGFSRFALKTRRTNEFRAEEWEVDDDDYGAAATTTTTTTAGDGARGVNARKKVRGCRYVTMEVMTGPLAYAVKRMYGERLQEAFETWADDLAAWVERGGGGGGSVSA